MILRRLFDLFRGRTTIQLLVSQKPSLNKAILSFGIVFLVIMILLGVEFIIGILASALLVGRDIVDIVISLLILGVVGIILVPVLLVMNIVASFVWGGFHFFVAGLMKKANQKVIEFNSLVLMVFASVTMISGLKFLK